MWYTYHAWLGPTTGDEPTVGMVIAFIIGLCMLIPLTLGICVVVGAPFSSSPRGDIRDGIGLLALGLVGVVYPFLALTIPAGAVVWWWLPKLIVAVKTDTSARAAGWRDVQPAKPTEVDRGLSRANGAPPCI
jgi:hypothetical protein